MMKLQRSILLCAIAILVLALPAQAAANEANEEALREAARSGDLAAVKDALADGAAIEAGDRYNATALFLAARAGHLEVALFLAERGANVNAAESFYGSLPLDAALGNGHLELAKSLLGLGAESREGALAFAVESEDIELARAVTESGPVNVSALKRLKKRADDPNMTALLARALSRLDPAPPSLAAADLDRMVGRFEGWSSDTFAEAKRDGDRLLLIINQGEPVVLEPMEQGGGGMVETTFRSSKSAVEASFWGRYGSVEGIYLTVDDSPTEMLRRSVAEPVLAKDRAAKDLAAKDRAPEAVREPQRRTVQWPGFRGQDGDGIGDGVDTLVQFNLDNNGGVRFKVPLPGLGNSSPVVWGDKVFLTTAIAEGTQESLRVGDTGSGESLEENSVHSWQVLAFDKKTGRQLWATEIGRGVPLTGRHFKATQANSTPVTDGKHLIVVFPTAGIASLNMDGEILWRHELGGLNASAFTDPGQEWGYASSPILYEDTVILQVDVAKGPVDEGAYLSAWNLNTGKPVWKVPRDVAPSFSTPTLLHSKQGDELVVNGSTIYGYDPKTGKELWSLGPNSELVIARPVVGDEVVYVSAGYAPIKPIYAIKAGTRGKIDVTTGQQQDGLAWSHNIGGAYMPTPLLYRGLLYVVHHNGRMVAYDARSGDALYKTRFSEGGTFTGSPIAVNGKLYISTEEGQMYVIAAGTEYQELAINEFDEPLMATPAVSEGTLYVRTPGHLYAIAKK